jgi:integral membrane protein (TIGR01906 family)
MNKQKLASFFIIFCVILIPFVIYIANVRYAAFNKEYYSAEFAQYNPDVKDSDNIVSDLLYFIRHKEADDSYLSTFSGNERSHMNDVRDVFGKFFLALDVFLFLLILFAAAIVSLDWRKSLEHIGKILLFGGFAAIIFTFVMFLLTINFDWFFTSFHQMFFTGNWQFSANDLLIKLFPSQFWVDMTNTIIVNVLLNTAVIVAVGGVILFLNKKFFIHKNPGK